MNCKYFVLLVCLILTIPFPASAETGEFGDFKQNLLGITISDREVYQAKLESIVENARNQGAPFAQLIIVALEVRVPLDLFIAAAMKFYSTEEIVLAAITSGGKPGEIIKIAIRSGGDPVDVESGAILAGISPVEVATLVSAALNSLSANEEKESRKKLKDEEGLGTTPGNGDGGLPGGDGIGPVGGDGGGIASPS